MRRLAYAALLVLMAGCGGAADAPPERGDARAGIADGRTLIAALGDSITAGSPYWDPNPAVRAQIGPELDPESQYPLWADLKLGDRYAVRNCGVFGERTDQIAARFDSCTAGADALIVQGGINDIAQRRPVEEAAANLRAMIRRGRERFGDRVLVTDVLPWNNGDRRAARDIVRLNELIEQIVQDEGVRLLRFNEALADPARPARMLPRLTADGDHPSVAGYRRLGRLVPRP